MTYPWPRELSLIFKVVESDHFKMLAGLLSFIL